MSRIALVLSLALLVSLALVGCQSKAGPPDPDFMASITAGYVPVTIQFSDSSQGDVTSWAWDFDGDKLVDSTARNPKYTFTAPGVYTIMLRASGPGGAALETKTDYIQLFPPIENIYGINPSSGKNGETLDVVITGADFTGASSLNLGEEVTINNFTVASPTQIKANISIGLGAAPTLRDVTVTISEGTSILPDGFTIQMPNTPTVTGVSPVSADKAAKLDVIITGEYFELISSVDFQEGITVNSITVDSTTQITANISVATTAEATSRDVVVINPGGSGTLKDGFKVTTPLSPVVTSASPSIGSRGESMYVIITGNSFWGASEVLFRSGTDVKVNNFSIDDIDRITASISIFHTASIGPRDITVITPGGSGTLTSGFQVVGMSPSGGSQGNTLSVVIEGADFTDTSDLSFGEGITVNSFTINSPTQITADISIAANATPGLRDITISNADGGSQVYAGSFTVSYPTCTASFTASRTTGSGVTTVKFTDTSSGDVTGWAWDFNGDGTTDSRERNPSHIYTKNGTYTVSLTVTGQYCQDTETKSGYIKISGCST